MKGGRMINMMHDIITEETFIACLLAYPEQAGLYSDLTRDHFTQNYCWEIYQDIQKEEPGKLNFTGVVPMLSQIKAEKRINHQEMMLAIDLFSNVKEMLTPFAADEAYKKLIADRNKTEGEFRIGNILNSRIEFEDKIAAINEIVQEQLIKPDDEVIYSASELEKQLEKNGEPESSGVVTGIKDIDRRIDVPHNCLMVIAARPFQGKTTFACKLAMENTIKHKVLFFSLEMTRYQIAKKLLNYGPKYNHDRLMIIERGAISLSSIIRTAMRLKPGLIIIDQLNKIQAKGEKEYDRFTNIARELKLATSFLRIPILCLCQINRSAENKRPYLWQIKGSGSVEEEADVALLLHIENYEKKETVVYMDKNRTKDGALRTARLTFDIQTSLYREAY